MESDIHKEKRDMMIHTASDYAIPIITTNHSAIAHAIIVGTMIVALVVIVSGMIPNRHQKRYSFRKAVGQVIPITVLTLCIGGAIAYLYNGMAVDRHYIETSALKQASGASFIMTDAETEDGRIYLKSNGNVQVTYVKNNVMYTTGLLLVNGDSLGGSDHAGLFNTTDDGEKMQPVSSNVEKRASSSVKKTKIATDENLFLGTRYYISLPNMSSDNHVSNIAVLDGSVYVDDIHEDSYRNVQYVKGNTMHYGVILISDGYTSLYQFGSGSTLVPVS